MKLLLNKASRTQKSTLFLFIELLINIISINIIGNLDVSIYDQALEINLFLIAINVFLFIPIFFIFGLYSLVYRYFSLIELSKIFFAVLTTVIFLVLINFLYNNDPSNITTFIYQNIIFFFLVILIRILVSNIILYNQKKNRSRVVLIYGAGAAGRQLMSSLSFSDEDNMIGFVDDDENKQGSTILGFKIYSRDEISKLIKKNGVNCIYLAIANNARIDRNTIISNLRQFRVKIFSIPSLDDIVSKKQEISQLKLLNFNDLLPKILDKKDYIFSNLRSKTVIVTGGGGSIGSQLCRQLINSKVKHIIIIDHSEHSLYQIDREIRREIEILDEKIMTTSILKDITQINAMREIFENFSPDIVFHAAAYKHVPLIESNKLSGLYNNFIGTKIIADLSDEFNVQKFVLISTDKAVNPINVMGLSKRLSEMYVQSLNECSEITYSIVRFGNVAGSSGSVLPLFRDQIDRGGPVTVTDPNATRYFMSIDEAVILVLQSSEISKGGEIFVLNMGEPHNITDIAKRVIELSGFTYKSDENPDKYDIDIIYTGLRPGEKLEEDLFINGNFTKTDDPNIFLTQNGFAPLSELNSLYDKVISRNTDDKENIENLIKFIYKLCEKNN